MKSKMQTAFESWYEFEVCDEMDIQTCVAWANWQVAWNAALEHARQKANEHAATYAYTPAQKRALGAWMQKAILTEE